MEQIQAQTQTENITEVKTPAMYILPENLLGQFRSYAKGGEAPEGQSRIVFDKVVKAYKNANKKNPRAAANQLKDDLLDVQKTKTWISYLNDIQKPKIQSENQRYQNQRNQNQRKR